MAVTAVHAQDLDAKLCMFADCAVGDAVVTRPTPRSGPSCSRQGATIFAFYVAHPMLPPGPERDRVETELRLRAGVRTREEALRLCHPTPAGQRAKVIQMGAYKTGLLKVAPVDGSDPYWVSSLDVAKP